MANVLSNKFGFHVGRHYFFCKSSQCLRGKSWISVVFCSLAMTANTYTCVYVSIYIYIYHYSLQSGNFVGSREKYPHLLTLCLHTYISSIVTYTIIYK